MSSTERMRKMRARLATPEVIEEDQTMEILRRNGYAVDTAGNIEPNRRHPSDALVSWDRGTPSRGLRYGHTHLGVIRIDTSDSNLIAAVVAAVDEPAALVGTSKDSAVLVFRVGPSYAVGSSPQAADEFVTADGKPGLFSTDAQPFDVAAFTWRNERSPLNTPLMLLPPMYVDITQAASGALSAYLQENGGRFGPLVLPETQMERMLREGRARMAAAVVETPEEADEKLVAANPDLRPTDGTLGIRVSQARARITDRKQEAQRAEKMQKAQRDKANMKELQARAGNPT